MFLREGSSGGAASPEAVVERLVVAIEAQDALGALQFVSPAESEGAVDFLQAVTEFGKTSGLFNLGGSAAAANFDLEITGVDSTELAKNAARVEFTISADFGATGAAQQLFGSGDELADDLDTSIIVVKEGGGWFLSPMLTAGDLLTEAFDLPEGDFDAADVDRETSSATTGEEAVELLVTSAAELDLDGLQQALAQGEARFVSVFEESLDKIVDRIDEELTSEGVELDLDEVVTADSGDGAIELKEFTLDITSSFDDAPVSMTLDGDCLQVSQEGWEKCALKNAPLTKPLESDQVVLLTADQDGSPRVRLVASVLSLATQVAQRIDRPTLLEALDLEFLDDAQPATFGDALDTESGETYQVFELDVPSDTDFSVAAESADSDSYIDWDIVTLNEDGQWQWAYGPFDEDQKLRLVLRPSCTDWDSEAMFDCADRELPDGTIRVGEDARAAATFPEGGRIDLEQLQRGSLTFTVATPTTAMMSVDGTTDYYLSGPSITNSDSSITFDVGEYTLELGPGSDNEVTLGFQVVEGPSGPMDISSSSPETTFDLAEHAYQTFYAYADTGDYVTITAYANDGQDIVLEVAASANIVCDAVDFGVSGDSESCSFSVSSGGSFDVRVWGYSDSDAYGSVTVQFSRS